MNYRLCCHAWGVVSSFEPEENALPRLDCPLLVLAGPGSGKTHFLACRITRALSASPPQACLAHAALVVHALPPGQQAAKRRATTHKHGLRILTVCFGTRIGQTMPPCHMHCSADLGGQGEAWHACRTTAATTARGVTSNAGSGGTGLSCSFFNAFVDVTFSSWM